MVEIVELLFPRLVTYQGCPKFFKLAHKVLMHTFFVSEGA